MKFCKIVWMVGAWGIALSICLAGCAAQEDVQDAGGSALPPPVVSGKSTATATASASATASGSAVPPLSDKTGELTTGDSGTRTRKNGSFSTVGSAVFATSRDAFETSPAARPGGSTERPAAPAVRPATPDTDDQMTALPTVPPVQDPIDFSLGNTFGNIANGGGFAAKNNLIYYSNYKDNNRLYRMNMDGSNRKKLSDDSAVDISVVGGRIYYVSFPEKGLYSVKTDGTDKRTLYTGQAGALNVTGGRIYYCDVDDGYRLYSMKTDGTNRKKLSDDWIHELLVEGDRIYYTIYNESRHIYTMKTDGTGRKKLNNDDALCLQLGNGRLYYFVVEGGERGIYSIKTDGTDRRTHLVKHVQAMHVCGDDIYYIDFYTNEWYRMNTVGGGLKKLGVFVSSTLYMAGDRLFCADQLGGWTPINMQ